MAAIVLLHRSDLLVGIITISCYLVGNIFGLHRLHEAHLHRAHADTPRGESTRQIDEAHTRTSVNASYVEHVRMRVYMCLFLGKYLDRWE